MSKSFSIQFFEVKDLDEVVHINWTSLPENYDNSFFLSLFSHYPRTFLVAKEGGRVIGYITGRVETGFSELKRFSLNRKGHIVSVAVLPEHRKKGVASGLLAKALEGFKEYNVSECFLEVRESNKAAINLYKKFGFSVTRHIRGYYRDGETAYVMSKPMVE